MSTTYIDNRDHAEMGSYLEQRVYALRTALTIAEKDLADVRAAKADVELERDRLLALVDGLAKQNQSLRDQLNITDNVLIKVFEC